jgi:hypothetical protein
MQFERGTSVENAAKCFAIQKLSISSRKASRNKGETIWKEIYF